MSHTPTRASTQPRLHLSQGQPGVRDPDDRAGRLLFPPRIAVISRPVTGLSGAPVGSDARSHLAGAGSRRQKGESAVTSVVLTPALEEFRRLTNNDREIQANGKYYS